MTFSRATADPRGGGGKSVSTESVLNFAFISFILFVVFQAFFALMANSQSMLADCEAMSVDALTYLFNLCAERIKHRPCTPQELQLPPRVRQYRREIQRLYLELIPPTISVATLIAVTVFTLREALTTLLGETAQEEEDEDVSATIMFFFSGANLLLDIVNMTCFARADSTYGIDLVRRGSVSIAKGVQEAVVAHRRVHSYASLPDSGGGAETVTAAMSTVVTSPTRPTAAAAALDRRNDLQQQQQKDVNEQTGLLAGCCVDYDNNNNNMKYKDDHVIVTNGIDDDEGDNDDPASFSSASRVERFSSSRLTPAAPHELVNLNMCSAWTHVCADTMRSTAVLIAAGLAFVVPNLVPAVADSLAAIVVSIIILGSLIPLLQGLCLTAIEIYSLVLDPPKEVEQHQQQQLQPDQPTGEATTSSATG